MKKHHYPSIAPTILTLGVTHTSINPLPIQFPCPSLYVSIVCLSQVLAVKKHHYQRSVQSARSLILPPPPPTVQPATDATTTTSSTTHATATSSPPSTPTTPFSDDPSITWRDVYTPHDNLSDALDSIACQTPSQNSAHPSQISAPPSQTPRPATDVAAACEGLFWSPQVIITPRTAINPH